MNFFNRQPNESAKVHAMPSPSDELKSAAHAAEDAAKNASKQKNSLTRIQLREALSEFSVKLNEKQRWYTSDPPPFYTGNGDSEMIKDYLVWYEHLKTIYENDYNDKLNGGSSKRKKQSKSRRKQTKRKRRRSIKSRRNYKR